MKKAFLTIHLLFYCLSIPVFSHSSGTSVPDDELPSVEWVSVKTAHQGNGAYLHWVTGKEMNSEYFEVERSFDGYTFEEVAEVFSAPGKISTHFYQYLDPNLKKISAEKIFYRLKQVDNQGNASYSPVVELVIRPEEAVLFISGKMEEKSGILNINYHATASSELIIKNVLGQSFFLKEVEPMTTENIQISTTHWPKGTYFLTLYQDGKKALYKVVKN